MESNIPRGPRTLLPERVAAIRYGITRPKGGKKQSDGGGKSIRQGIAAFMNVDGMGDGNVQRLEIGQEVNPSLLSSRDNIDLVSDPNSSAAPNAPREKMKYFTCSYWANGRCRYTAEECLYAHNFTPRVADLPNLVDFGGPCVAGRASEERQADIRRERRLANAETNLALGTGVNTYPGRAPGLNSPLLSTTPDQDIIATPGNTQVVVNLPGSRLTQDHDRSAETIDNAYRQELLGQDLLYAIESGGGVHINPTRSRHVVPALSHHPDIKTSLQVHDLLINRRDSENAVNYWRSMVPHLMAQKRELEAIYGEDKTQVQGDAIIEQVLSINHFVTNHNESVLKGNELLESFGLGHLCKDIEDNNSDRPYVRGWRKEDDDEWW